MHDPMTTPDLEGSQVMLALSAYRKADDRYQRLVETALVGIYETTLATGEVKYANTAVARMFEYERPQEIWNRRAPAAYARPGQREEFLALLARTGSVAGMELDFVTHTGRRITVIASANLEGETISGMIIDITARKQLEQELERSAGKHRDIMLGVLHTMSAIVERRDPYTAGHQQQVADLAGRIAARMGLSHDEIEGIFLAGMIHDMGKMYVPVELLVKPARLTKSELALVRGHAQAGYDILRGIDFPWPIAEIVYQHHERLDGSGYPRKLKGDEINLAARIIAVADVMEAMSSPRPYRPCQGIDKAIRELKGRRSVLYDPAAVDACLAVI